MNLGVCQSNLRTTLYIEPINKYEIQDFFFSNIFTKMPPAIDNFLFFSLSLFIYLFILPEVRCLA